MRGGGAAADVVKVKDVDAAVLPTLAALELGHLVVDLAVVVVAVVPADRNPGAKPHLRDSVHFNEGEVKLKMEVK